LHVLKHVKSNGKHGLISSVKYIQTEMTFAPITANPL